jgi:hypothetical protein
MNSDTASTCACDTCDTHPGLAVSRPGHCPQCALQGKRVQEVTLKAMLAVSLAELRAIPYYFCRTADCAVIYFSADGTQTFSGDMLRERVFQKAPGDDTVWVCYCFRHTAENIRTDLLTTPAGTVLPAIEQATAAGQCACELRNPQGSCCLGNVRALVQILKQSLPDTAA